MTLLMALLLVSLTIVPSCRKEGQTRWDIRYTVFSQGSDYFLNVVLKEADKERAKDRPEPYDSTINRLYAGFVVEWNDHIIAELDAFTGTVNNDYRDKPQDHWAWLDRDSKWTVEKAYDYERAGFDPKFFELCESILEDLHKVIRNYVITDVNGQWSSGDSKQASRDAVFNFLKTVDTGDDYGMTYGDKFKAAIKDYVITGKLPTHHGHHRNGWWMFRAKGGSWHDYR